MTTLRFLFVAVILTGGAQPAFAQNMPEPAQTVELYELVLKDGSRVFGTIERQSDAEVVLRTQSGDTVTARRENIASLRLVKGRIERGEFLRPDLHRTRLFFAPTGRSLQRGETSFGVFQFIAPFVQVGLTDRISVGGGTPLLFGVEDWHRPFWITPKVQVVRTERAQAAVGLLHVFDFDGDNAGIAYGVSTFGDNDNAATVGAGLAYMDDDRGWVVMGGAEGRLTRNLKVITENYVWKGGQGILSGGVRILGERLSADLALAVPLGVNTFIAVPVVNFAYVF